MKLQHISGSAHERVPATPFNGVAKLSANDREGVAQLLHFLRGTVLATALFASATTDAFAGSTDRVSTDLEVVTSVDGPLNEAMLALKNLEDEPGITVDRYLREAAEIKAAFIAQREADYRALRATEVMTAFTQARRPGLFKGRRSDTAIIESDPRLFADWEVAQVEQHQLRQKANGENWASVVRLPDNGGVRMTVFSRSPKHDSFRGRTLREEMVTVTYHLREEVVQRLARSDAALLLTLGGSS
ncbi:MAG: hypothetical protein AAF919_17300 [Pseudomonadota bacterium]